MNCISAPLAKEISKALSGVGEGSGGLKDALNQGLEEPSSMAVSASSCHQEVR